MNHGHRAAVLWAAASAYAAPAAAIMARHDVDGDDYRVDDDAFPAVVDLFAPGDCLGTLVRPDAILTVAHCAVDLDRRNTLSIGGDDHAIAAVHIHPRYRGFRNDIALVRLVEPVVGVAPMAIDDGSVVVGDVLTLVGRGLHGIGSTGEPDGLDDGRLRRATNRVTNVQRHWLEVTFDAPGEPGVLPLEGVGAAGDSGGPALLDTPSGPRVVGLNAWGDRADGVAIGAYGSRDYSTRVALHRAWLQRVLDGGDGGRGRGCSHATGAPLRLYATLLVVIFCTYRRQPTGSGTTA